MKILMRFHAAPWPPEMGPSRRTHHILTEALRRHDVSLVSFATAAERDGFTAHFGTACRDAVFIERPPWRASFSVACGAEPRRRSPPPRRCRRPLIS